MMSMNLLIMYGYLCMIPKPHIFPAYLWCLEYPKPYYSCKGTITGKVVNFAKREQCTGSKIW